MDHVYKTVELTGSSSEGIDHAIKRAVERASKTLHDMRWLEVTEIRGHLEKGEIQHWQVGVKVGFTLDDTTDA